MASFLMINRFKFFQLADQPVNFDATGSSIRLAVLSGKFDYSTESTWASVRALSVSGGNWSQEGVLLTSKTLAASNQAWRFDAADVVISGTATGFSDGLVIVVYASIGGTPASAPLICAATADSTFGNTGGNVTIQFDSQGLFDLQ